MRSGRYGHYADTRRILEVAIALAEAETDVEYERAYNRFRKLVYSEARKVAERWQRTNGT